MLFSLAQSELSSSRWGDSDSNCFKQLWISSWDRSREKKHPQRAAKTAGPLKIVNRIVDSTPKYRYQLRINRYLPRWRTKGRWTHKSPGKCQHCEDVMVKQNGKEVWKKCHRMRIWQYSNLFMFHSFIYLLYICIHLFNTIPISVYFLIYNYHIS